MNKHILLVMKWLRNPESVTQLELNANHESSWANYRNAAYRYAAYRAAAYSVADVTRGVSHWVDRHFQITGEDKQTYIDALGE
jgi:hypothetical protein